MLVEKKSNIIHQLNDFSHLILTVGSFNYLVTITVSVGVGSSNGVSDTKIFPHTYTPQSTGAAVDDHGAVVDDHGAVVDDNKETRK